MLVEVGKFVEGLHDSNPQIVPLVVKTRKGYHVYIYLDRVYEVTHPKEVYIELMKKMIPYEMKYLDKNVIEDVMRLSRFPFSVHEVSGEKCPIVKLKKTEGKYSFISDKVRSLSIQRISGFHKQDVIWAIQVARDKAKEKGSKSPSRQRRK